MRHLRAVLTVILAACLLFSPAVWADDLLTIGLMPRSLGNPIFLDAFESAQQKAQELGVRVDGLPHMIFLRKGR